MRRAKSQSHAHLDKPARGIDEPTTWIAVAEPDAEAIQSVRMKVCPAMLKIGVDFATRAGLPAGDLTAELVGGIFASMRAQEIVRDQQMARELCRRRESAA